jgi:hypothetical protein
MNSIRLTWPRGGLNNESICTLVENGSQSEQNLLVNGGTSREQVTLDERMARCSRPCTRRMSFWIYRYSEGLYRLTSFIGLLHERAAGH